jgi:hypothetical protein
MLGCNTWPYEPQEPYAVSDTRLLQATQIPRPEIRHTYFFTRQIPFNTNDGGVGCLRNVGRLPFYRTTWRDVPEDPNLSIHRDENLRHKHTDLSDPPRKLVSSAYS